MRGHSTANLHAVPQSPPPGRNETDLERCDRNLVELLQEVRVVQTGVQVLFAFLLMAPLTPFFRGLAGRQHAEYYVTFGLAGIAAFLLMAPTAYHRVLFRRGDKSYLVSIANRLTIAGLAAIGMSMVVAVAFVTDVIFGPWPGLVAGGVAGLLCLSLWAALPLARRRRLDASASPPPRHRSPRWETAPMEARLLSVNVGLPRDVEWQGRTVHTGDLEGAGGRAGGWCGASTSTATGRATSPATAASNRAGVRLPDRVLPLLGGAARPRRLHLRPVRRELHRRGPAPTTRSASATATGSGTALFEVTQPRVTCYRVGIRMDEPRMPALLVAHRRPGFYLRVLEEGEVGRATRSTRSPRARRR